MSNKDYSGTRKNVSKTMLGNLAETLGFKKGLSYKQLMTEAASLSQKAVKQGLKRAGWKGAIALGALEAIGYGGAKLIEKTRSTPTTKSTTKTYAEMVKEDKEKGKSKVLSRRAPDAPPRKPKELRDKDVKEEKKFNLKTGGKGSAKERLNEIQKEKLAAKQKKLVKGSQGVATGLKMPTTDQTGLKKLPTPVRNKMGYMYGGGMMNKKPRMSSMDYRKGGLLVISVDMMKNKKKSKEK